MSSYMITFTASVKVEAETAVEFRRARDVIEDAVAEALPGLDTFDITRRELLAEKVVTVPGGTGTRPIL
jgi:uncharacterized protein GlcG (DUF336 family)